MRNLVISVARPALFASVFVIASCGGGGGADNGGGVSGPFGLESRPANLTCIAPARPGGDATAATVDAFPTAPAFAQPTKILQAPGDPSRWFVLEKTGRIRVFSVSNPAAVTTWLDFSTLVNDNSEGGMLGMAFHPDYPATWVRAAARRSTASKLAATTAGTVAKGSLRARQVVAPRD